MQIGEAKKMNRMKQKMKRVQKNPETLQLWQQHKQQQRMRIKEHFVSRVEIL